METLWDRTKQGFEKILTEGEKAAEKMVQSLGELSEAAKARLEKARLERALFKRSAELGNAVYELHRSARESAGSGPVSSHNVLGEPRVKDLLSQLASLDEDLQKMESQIPRR